MKTVKFKDLPEKVQTFLYENQHSLGYFYPENDIQLNWLHNISIWDKATDEERLAYAEWKYPDGTYISSAFQTHGLVSKEFEVWEGAIFVRAKDNQERLCMFSSNTKKWASIISEPEKEEQPEFKAGDDCFYCYHKYNIVAVKKGKAWIANESSEFIVDLSDLDKPDPDKVYREMAKEIMKTDRLPNNGTHTLYEKNEVESMLIEMGKKVEALKKGKDL